MLPFFVHAQEFPNYAIQAILARDGTLGIEEHFTFDYGQEGNHGVLREVPLFTPGKNASPLTFHFISVADKAGVPYKHDASGGGNVALIRVGDKDVVLTGPHYYDLRYSLSGAATENTLRWQITTPVKEVVKKFQADVYFTIPVPPVTATGTCAFVPQRGGRECVLTPLIKEDKLYGYRISAENVSKEGVVLQLQYPRGLVEPPKVITRDTPKEFPKYVWPALLGIVFLVLLAVILWHYREHIKRWQVERKKPVHFPDTYSYLARAMAQNGHIVPKDIIATVTDLTARGYIILAPIAHPVGEYEFIDYALNIPELEFPLGSEGALLRSFEGGVDSFDGWLRDDLQKHILLIEDAARKEIEHVVLLRSDETLPDLPGFKSERY